MADQDVLLASLNAGEVSPLALARVDLAKLKVASAVHLNWLPHVLGPTIFRPGTEYIATAPGSNPAWLGEFYVSETEVALLVVTAPTGLSVLVNDQYVQRVSVATAITNGTFSGSLTGWTQSDQAGATSSWAAGNLMELVGTGANYALRDQQITVAGGDVGKEHAIRLVVNHGNVLLMVGTSQGDGTYWNITLKEGTYSLAFTPTGNFWIRLGGADFFGDYVSSIAIEGPNVVELPVPWSAADFDLIRYDQSVDVMFLAAASDANTTGYQQMEIGMFDNAQRSWGISYYFVDDGPFRPENTSPTTISPSDVHGSITLTASQPIFQPGHVNSTWALTQSGQTATATLGGANQQTGNIEVTGVTSPTNERIFAINVSGTFSATVVLQRSLGAPGAWTDVESWTAPVSTTLSDGLDNQIVYYRLAIESAYVSGSALCTLNYSGSVQTGNVRITAVADDMHATADVLTQLGTVGQATSQWSEGEWSSFRGWPAAVVLHEGRLFWGAGVNLDGSVSDAFDSFDPTTQGDSGPIDRTIDTGGLDGCRWLLSLQRLLIGTFAQEISVRASSLDEPLTPTAFVARACSTRGGTKLRALRIDQQGIFVGRNAQRVYELSWNAQTAYFDYTSHELTRLHQEICQAGVVDLAVQRQPDTRIWFVLGDGTCAVLTYDKDDDVEAWSRFSTPNGFIERVASLPNDNEDSVYFVVNRTILSSAVRYIEKLAMRSEAQGGTLNKTSDCATIYSGSPTNTISIAQLAGQQVVVWADGAPLVTAAAPVTVPNGGTLTLPNGYMASNAVVGLAYTGQIETAKLAFAAEKGTAVTQQKRVGRIGLVMQNVSWQGLQYGANFTTMRSLPATYKGPALPTSGAGQVIPSFDTLPTIFSGGYDSDSRVCVQIQSPHCCELMALALYMKTNEPDDAPPQQNGQGGR